MIQQTHQPQYIRQQHQQILQANRKNRWKVKHIQSDQSEEDCNSNVQNQCNKQLMRQQSNTKLHLLELIIKNDQRSEQVEIKTKANDKGKVKGKEKRIKKAKIQRTPRIKLADIGLFEDINEYDNLPQECQRTNQLHKAQSFQQLYEALVKCIGAESKTKTIVVSGEPSSAKKTIITAVLSRVRKQMDFRKYNISFKQTIHNDMIGKAKELCQYLKDALNLDQISQSNILKRIIIIDNYQSFIIALKESSLMHCFTQIVKNSKSNIFIMVSCNPSKQILSFTGKYETVTIVKNSRQYFMESMMAFVNNYNSNRIQWELMRPLANFISTKIQGKGCLFLTIIRKLVIFLQAQSLGMQQSEEKVIVNRSIIEKFMHCITNNHTQIDLRQLTIHQKALLTACYLICKQEPQLLISMDKAYKNYLWVCGSLGAKGKEMKQFIHNIIYQLQVYKVLKLQRGEEPKKKYILVNLDMDYIKSHLEDELVLKRFFSQC